MHFAARVLNRWRGEPLFVGPGGGPSGVREFQERTHEKHFRSGDAGCCGVFGGERGRGA